MLFDVFFLLYTLSFFLISLRISVVIHGQYRPTYYLYSKAFSYLKKKENCNIDFHVWVIPEVKMHIFVLTTTHSCSEQR